MRVWKGTTCSSASQPTPLLKTYGAGMCHFATCMYALQVCRQMLGMAAPHVWLPGALLQPAQALLTAASACSGCEEAPCRLAALDVSASNERDATRLWQQ